MNNETPLPEVISFIPRDIAEHLMYLPIDIQMWVARGMRDIMVGWEQSDVRLDPITLENVLRPVVVQLMAAGHALIDSATGREA